MSLPVTVEAVNAFAATELPFTRAFGFSCEWLGDGEAIARWRFSPQWTRPVDFVCGPVMMGLADLAVYFAVFTKVGITPLALTNELKTNFLRPAAGRDLLAHARIPKLGRRIAFAVVDISEEGDPERLVAHATASYVLPGGA